MISHFFKFACLLSILSIVFCSDDTQDQNKKSTRAASYFMVGCMVILMFGYAVFITQKFYGIVVDRIDKFRHKARIGPIN